MIAWLPGITFALRLGPHDSSLVETMQYFLAAALMLGMLSGNSALSQEAEGVANYAYAIFFGTGKYSVSDRNIYVLRAPLVFTLREPDYAHGKAGLRLLVPAAAGITDFDEFTDIPGLRVDDLQTASVAPGIEAQIPIKENWLLSPFGQAGLGWDFNSSENSLIWGVGARSRAWFGEGQRFVLGGEILWAGNRPNTAQPNTRFSRVAIGGEYKWPTRWSAFGRRLHLLPRLVQTFYLDPADIDQPRDTTRINRSTEIGLSLGLETPLVILGYPFVQGGISVEFADGVKAIKLITRFPY